MWMSAMPLKVTSWWLKVDEGWRMNTTYLEIGGQLLYDSFPSYETFYENISWFQILKLDVCLDKGLIPGHWRPIPAATAGPRVLIICSGGHDKLLWREHVTGNFRHQTREQPRLLLFQSSRRSYIKLSITILSFSLMRLFIEAVWRAGVAILLLVYAYSFNRRLLFLLSGLRLFPFIYLFILSHDYTLARYKKASLR